MIGLNAALNNSLGISLNLHRNILEEQLGHHWLAVASHGAAGGGQVPPNALGMPLDKLGLRLGLAANSRRNPRTRKNSL